jgi:hypothetical protein
LRFLLTLLLLLLLKPRRRSPCCRYMTGGWSGGLMLAFFLGQVPLMAAERRLAAVLRWAGWGGAPGTARVAVHECVREREARLSRRKS